MAAIGLNAFAQFNESGISAGFFDSSNEKSINFSEFHLPPLAVLFENAKSTPQILTLAKAQEIAQAEVAKQKRHIFSYVTGHASYSYGVSDMWGNSSSSYNMRIMQFQGSEQKYWNVGVNLAVPLEDILDLGAAVRRKKLEVDQAQLKKDMAYDQLKLQIATLYVTITNDLVTLKTASESAAMFQGAGALNLEDFHNGNMSIADFAYNKTHENGIVQTYQNLQTKITTDILTLEILTHTPRPPRLPLTVMSISLRMRLPRRTRPSRSASRRLSRKKRRSWKSWRKPIARQPRRPGKKERRNKQPHKTTAIWIYLDI